MDMQTLEQRYLKVTKMFGLIVGTWPYQSQCQKWFYRGFFLVIATSSIITMVSNIAMFFNMQTITDQVPILMVALAMTVKHVNFIFNDGKFKGLFNSMLNDWQEEKTPEEETIMEMYADRGVFFAFVYALNAYCCSAVFLFLPLMPRLMDILVPLNESRPWIQMYSAYYFIENEDDYYFFIILYSTVSLLSAMCAFIAADTTLIYLVQHACGLFALSGHRFENSVDQMHGKTDSNAGQETYRRVCYAIDTHKRALAMACVAVKNTVIWSSRDDGRWMFDSFFPWIGIEGARLLSHDSRGCLADGKGYLNEIEKLYALNLFVQVGLVILSFTVTLLKVTTIALSMETYPYYGYVIAQVVHVFFLTIQGQFVIDSHDSVYSKGFEAQWYNVQCKTQALFILIFRQNLTPPMLTAGGLIQLNLDSFAAIVKMCVSYFTVLKSA